MIDHTDDAVIPGGAGCRQFDVEVAAYLEGEDRPALLAHARGCPYCAAVLADLKQISSLSLELDNEEPPARLWANVRAALVAEGLIRPTPSSFWQRFLQPRWALSPVAVAGLACLIVVGVRMIKPPSAESPRVIQTAGFAVTPPVDLQDMERQFQSSTMDPALVASYRKGLESINGEIQECQDSVRKNPDDTMAREYLNIAFAEKARVLQSALESVGR